VELYFTYLHLTECYLIKDESRYDSVGMAAGYGLDDRMFGVRFPAGAGDFSLRHRVQIRSQPPIQWLPGALSLGVKRPGRETSHHLRLVPRSKNAWSYTSTPPILLHGVVLNEVMDPFRPWYLVKHRGNFTSPSCHDGVLNLTCVPVSKPSFYRLRGLPYTLHPVVLQFCDVPDLKLSPHSIPRQNS
jgi:hypothetical protein